MEYTLIYFYTHFHMYFHIKEERKNKQAKFDKKRENKTILNLQTLKTIIKINDYS